MGKKGQTQKMAKSQHQKRGRCSKHYLRRRLPLSHAFYLRKEKENRMQAHGIGRGDYLPEERVWGGLKKDDDA